MCAVDVVLFSVSTKPPATIISNYTSRVDLQVPVPICTNAFGGVSTCLALNY